MDRFGWSWTDGAATMANGWQQTIHAKHSTLRELNRRPKGLSMKVPLEIFILRSILVHEAMMQIRCLSSCCIP